MRIAILFLIAVLCSRAGASISTVTIEAISCTSPGAVVQVALSLQDTSGEFETGGFDLLVTHHSALSLQAAAMGQLLLDCDWEYFTYSLSYGCCIRLVAIAEISNGAPHPSCYGDSSGVLAELTFAVDNNPSLDGEFLPIQWIWFDCGDNAFSSRSGDSLFVSHDVYDLVGYSYVLITQDTSFPTLYGAPSECLADSSGILRTIDFYNGGIGVTVVDTMKPLVTCPGDTTANNDPDLCGTVVNFQANVVDNCPGATVTCTPASGTFFPVGITYANCIGIDAVGNADTCTFSVEVIDTTNPVIACASDTIVDNDSGECGAVVEFNTTASDNCVGSANCNPVSGTLFPIGTTPVICFVADAAGNGDLCSLSVTVNDTEAPTVGCPSDITVGNDPAECGAIVNFEVAANDNCPDPVLAVYPSSGSMFPIGTTAVQVTAADSVGNADTCQFTVTVHDTTRPSAFCPGDIEVFNDSGEYGAVVDFDVSATDNCAGVSVSADPPSGTLFPVGTTPVAIVAIDAAENADTCHFIVMVILNDPDGDGLPDWDDNCPQNYNPAQTDVDNDGLGDSCDTCTDTDGDGFGNPGFPANTCTVDNCPVEYNPDQYDTNGDGVGDACCCTGIRGNVDGDAGDGINIADLTTIVSYLFDNGDIPPCPDEANVDGSPIESINVADLTYLVEYLFRTGPPPPACP